MTPSTPQSKGLRNAMGALSLSFMMASGCATTSAPTTIYATPTPQQQPQRLLSNTTTASAMIADIERQANDYLRTTKNPALRVAILDIDQVNTTTGPNADSTRQKLYLHLQERDLNLSSKDYSGIFWSMGGPYGTNSNNPQALHLNTTNSNANTPDICVIIPETPDRSSRTVLEGWIGEAGPRHLRAVVDPGPYQMAKRVAWHETWHCMDREFVQARESIHKDLGFEYAHGIHRSEMFADVAATLTMASQGDLDILNHTADARAVHSRWNGPKMMEAYSPKTDAQYYSGISYYTTPAHDAALAHINSVGLDKVKTYSLADIQRIATDLTHKHALTKEEFRTATTYLEKGDSYVQALTQKASSGDANATRNVAFLNAYLTRTVAAKVRLLTKTATPVLKKEDVVPPTSEDLAVAIPSTMKLDIYTTMESAIRLAQGNGQTARQGVFNQLESWRKELHNAPNRRADLEEKLFLTGLLLSNGYLNDLLVPSTKNAAPKPSL